MENQLTTGTIKKKLTLLAFPIMGTYFLQMAYNMVDMIWIGKLGANAVAAIGTAGFFMWLSFSLVTLSRTGVEVFVSQSLGKKDTKSANEYVETGFWFALCLGILYGLLLIAFRVELIGFFKLQDTYVEGLGQSYLKMVAFSMPFTLVNQIISASYNASGQSKVPFRASAIGLTINMILDPILIFTADMGVEGAAVATTISQIIVTILLLLIIYKQKKPFEGYRLIGAFHMSQWLKMVKVSLPVALQNGLFTIISMFVARIVAYQGTTAVAVQKVGTQVEAITYMTANGFGAALSAFTGQNYGAGIMKRVKGGFVTAGAIMGVFGLFTGALMFFFAEPIFKLFINEEPALSMGITYLRIISLSQVFMCVEITLAGGFNGLGKSLPPALIGVAFNALRIPAAYYLSTQTAMGLNGIWWSINVSSMLKGTILVTVLWIMFRGMMKKGDNIRDEHI